MSTECNAYEGRTQHLDKRCYQKTVNVIPTKKTIEPRIVPPFSTQSRQKNTIVQPFPKSAPKKRYPVGKSSFRKHYLRGDIPIAMEFDNFGYKVSWKVHISELDYHHYLPIFFDGLCEIEHPFKFFAQNGIHDLITFGPTKILPVLPQLILPLKKDTGDEVDYGQRRRENIADLVFETLEILERTGGPDAFINIKYLIPTYESCVLN
uniref:Parkin coregulated gene protein homolog n=1 Tax=Rhodnius prolixus TaxID=13249 RepID=T1H9S3_RHOPR